jgi:hypothetical protein
MKFFKILILILPPSVFCFSCSKILLKADSTNTPTNCFNMMWKTLDEHYSFFDYKSINWQAVREKYAPQVNDSISQDSLFNVLSAMLYELRDGHVNLSTAVDRSRNWTWRDEYPDNFNSNFFLRNYLKKDFHLTGALTNQILPDSIGLMRYASFSSPIADGDLDYVMGRFKDMKGIIIDLRDNGGGSINNVYKLIGRFVEKRVLVGYNHVKTGKGHNDFGKAVALYADPAKKRTAFTKPIVLLVNRSCYSATTYFAGFMSVLPQVTLVGDKTGGGGGIPISSDLPNGWQYRFSATYLTLTDGLNIEHGVPVDFEVTTGAKEELEGKDAIVEKAIEIIKKSK